MKINCFLLIFLILGFQGFSQRKALVCGINTKYGTPVRNWDLANGIRTKTNFNGSVSNLIVEMMRLMNWPRISSEDVFDGRGQPFIYKINGANNAYASDELGWPTYPKVAAIFIDDDWINDLSTETHNQFIRATVIAHELGHCYYGHQYGRGAATTWQQEYDADVYTGQAMCKLGASLAEVKELFYKISDYSYSGVEDPDSHPSLPYRLEAVSKGWYSANCQNENFDGQPQSKWLIAANFKTVCWACSEVQGGYSTFGAIALKDDDGSYGISANYGTQYAAESRAMNECGWGCRVIFRFQNSCGVLVADDFGNWSAASGNTKNEAEWNAASQFAR